MNKAQNYLLHCRREELVGRAATSSGDSGSRGADGCQG